MMAVRPETFDFVSNFDTVWAVVLGAVLATLGGFAATQFERMTARTERERNAALLFGEVLFTLSLMLNVAGEMRGRGDPYGPITMRMLRSIRREVDVYERNRERLFELSDGALRARLHILMVRLAMPLDGIFDYTRELVELQSRSATPDLEALRTLLYERRDQGFDALLEMGDAVKGLIAALEPLARNSFQGLSGIHREM